MSDRPRQRARSLWNEFIADTSDIVHRFEFRTIPKESDRFVVTVEPRTHEHLEYALRNVMHFLGPGWGLQVFTGRRNREFVARMLDSWHYVHLCHIETDNLSAPQYNRLKKSPQFWELVMGEQVLWVEPDCLLCHAGVEEFMAYDYIGAPWRAYRPEVSYRDLPAALSPSCRVGNGGLSLRRRSAMLEIARTCNRDLSVFGPEDMFFSINMHLDPDRYRLPSVDTARRFAVETIFHPRPFGLHKPYQYLEDTELASLLDTIRYDG